MRILVLLAFLMLLAGPARAQGEAVSGPDDGAAPVFKVLDDKPIPTANVPLSQPNMDKFGVVSWAAIAVADAMTFDYNNYKTRTQKSYKYFTKTGWESFAGALAASRIIEGVVDQQLAVTAELRRAAELGQEGAKDGKYRWQVMIPLDLTYRRGPSVRLDTAEITVIVERLPTSPAGVGIVQWTYKLKSSKLKKK